MANKILVTYFSCIGNTKKLATNIANELKADLSEITPIKAYSREDLNFKDKNSRSSLEMNEDAARPEFKTLDKNIADYDVIFIGFPIWWDTNPKIIDTFLENSLLKDKIIVPFATSGGSRFNNVDKTLKDNYSSKMIIKTGIVMNGDFDTEEFYNWIKGIEL